VCSARNNCVVRYIPVIYSTFVFLYGSRFAVPRSSFLDKGYCSTAASYGWSMPDSAVCPLLSVSVAEFVLVLVPGFWLCACTMLAVS
jgi:hypothetical protein